MTSTQSELQPIIEQATREITRVANQSVTLTSFSQLSRSDLNDHVPVSVNLPKLHLPVFEGSVLRWPEFWDIFDASVHRQNIPKVSKFSYLKGALRGAAYLLPSLELLLLLLLISVQKPPKEYRHNTKITIICCMLKHGSAHMQCV